MFNALEAVVVNRYPFVGNLKSQLEEFGALGALMSGSGPTVFALMSDEFQAKAVAGKLSSETSFCITTTTSPVGFIII
jgi:4-diphosphocytidyl-2-C-methyl-D-erythritol kinase